MRPEQSYRNILPLNKVLIGTFIGNLIGIFGFRRRLAGGLT